MTISKLHKKLSLNIFKYLLDADQLIFKVDIRMECRQLLKA